MFFYISTWNILTIFIKISIKKKSVNIPIFQVYSNPHLNVILYRSKDPHVFPARNPPHLRGRGRSWSCLRSDHWPGERGKHGEKTGVVKEIYVFIIYYHYYIIKITHIMQITIRCWYIVYMYAILYIYSFGPLEEFESVCFLYKVHSFGCPKYPGMSFQPLHTRSWLSQPSAKPPKKTDSSPSKRRSVVCSLQFPFYGSTLLKKHALLGRSKIEKSRRNPHRGRPTSGEIMWNPGVCLLWTLVEKRRGRSPRGQPTHDSASQFFANGNMVASFFPISICECNRCFLSHMPIGP
jgi:hypothetical protein